jgi:hypothetical protein
MESVAKLVITDQTLTVALSMSEKIQAMQWSIKVPRWAVVGARTVADGMAEVRGVLGSGTEVPGRMMLGRLAHQGTVTFVVCRGHLPAVVIDLSGQAFDRLLLTIADPDAAIVGLV